MVDTHTHTRWSPDCESDPAEVARQARDAGLSGVAFTDHWDYGYDSINKEGFVPSAYAAAPDIRALAQGPADAAGEMGMQGGGFRVLRGVELSPMPHAVAATQELFSGLAFDYVLLSAHYVGEYPQHRFGQYYESRGKREAYAGYLEDLIRLARAYGDFDAIAHYDYIARYAPYADSLMRYDDAPGQFDELLGCIAQNGKALELNAARYGRPLNADGDLVDLRVLRRFKELGGEFACLGSDAHRPSDVGRGFGRYAGFLREAGFSRVTSFVARKPVLEPL